MNMNTRIRLSIMMFLQFYIWGAWYVTLGSYLVELKFTGAEIGSAYSTMNWGAIVAPFFVGMVADRFFSAEKVLAIAHLLGAGIIYYASTITDPGMLFWVLIAYALCYMPTLALVNAISFAQMQDTEKEFPGIRVWGTIGWIAAGLAITFLLAPMYKGDGESNIEATNIPMLIAAAVSVALGVFSFFLPNTPPKSAGHQVGIKDVLGLDALKLLKDPSFAVFVLCSLLVCIPLAFYYTFTNPFLNAAGMEGVAAKMTLGQMSEVAFMLVMPFFFRRLGIKYMLLVGMLAWVARYVLFAYGNSEAMVWMFYTGILLHGICYDFFFVTGQIYVDQTAPKSIQAAAQGFIALITYGIGMVIGNKIAGMTFDYYTNEGVQVWKNIWLVPAGMALLVAFIFLLFFREPKNSKSEALVGNADNA